MLSNADFLAKFRFDTAENEPAKNLQNFKFANFPNFANPNPNQVLARPAAVAAAVPAAVPAYRARREYDPFADEPEDDMPYLAAKIRRHDGRSAKFRQNVARFRLYRHRFLQENTRFAAFFKIYQII